MTKEEFKTYVENTFEKKCNVYVRWEKGKSEEFLNVDEMDLGIDLMKKYNDSVVFDRMEETEEIVPLSDEDTLKATVNKMVNRYKEYYC